MIAGATFLLCAYASVAIIAVVATLMAACDGGRGGWVFIALGIVMLVTDTFAALHTFGVIPVTLYKPVLIETEEQAEALPVGTLAAPLYEDGPDFVYALVRREETYEPWCNSDGSHARGHDDLDGFAALVPIEAEEGTDTIQTGAEHFYTRTRYITPWEEA